MASWLGSIILPMDLVEGAIATGKSRGWFSGSRLRAEEVLVAWARQDGENEIFTTYGQRMNGHRSLNPTDSEYSDQLLRWTIVKPGFSEDFDPSSPMSGAEFENWTGVPAKDLENRINYFCCLECGDKGPIISALIASPSETGIAVGFVDVTVLTLPAQPLVRIPEGVLHSLQDKRAVIVGLGSGGGEIALNLACTGLGSLDLVDYDLCKPENYFRHVGDKRDLGRGKISAIKSAIEDRELSTVVNIFDLNVVRRADEFRGILEPPPDILICSTDSLVSRRFLNCCSIHMNIPMVLAGTLDGGRIGEVMIVLPKISACYECVRLDLGATLVQPDVDDRSPTPYVDSEDKKLESAAFRFDITCVSSLATMAALGVLAPEHFSPMPRSYLVWSRDAGRGYAEPFRFDTPLGLNYVKIDRRRDCPVCGDLPSELVGVDVTKKVTEILGEISSQ